jgi:hypothetical protein
MSYYLFCRFADAERDCPPGTVSRWEQRRVGRARVWCWPLVQFMRTGQGELALQIYVLVHETAMLSGQ